MPQPLSMRSVTPLNSGVGLCPGIVTFILLLPWAFCAEPPPTDRIGDPMPQGAMARLGSARFRYESHHIEAIVPAFTDDRHFLVTSDGAHVYLWEGHSGRAIRNWEHPNWGFVRRLTLSHDGKLLAIATTRGIWLTGLAEASEIQLLDNWPPGGQRHLAWNAFMPDDSALVSLDSANEIRVIDLKTRKTRRTEVANLRANAGLSNDGKTLVIWNQDLVDFWDISSLRKAKSVQFPYTNGFRKLRLRADGSLIAVNLSNGGVVFWDPATQQETGRLDDSKIISDGGMQFLNKGDKLATVTRDQGMATVRIWNVATGKAERTLKLPSIESGDPALSSDGKTIAFAAASRNVSVRDLQTGNTLCGRCGFDAGPTSIAFGRGGRVIAVDGLSMCVWNQLSGELLLQTPQAQTIQGLLVPPDGKSAILSFGMTGLRQFDLQTGEVIGEFALPDSLTIERGGMSQSLDGRTLFVLADTFERGVPNMLSSPHRLIRWDMTTREPRIGWEIAPRSVAELFNTGVKRYRIAGSYLTELISEQRAQSLGNLGAIASAPAQVVIRDLTTDRIAATVLPSGNPEMAECNRSVLAVVSRTPFERMRTQGATREAVIECWEMGSDEPMIKYAVPDLTHFALSPDGYTVASSDHRTIEIRDYFDDRAPLRFVADSSVTCLSFSEDGRLLASGLENGTILIWDARRPAPQGSSGKKLNAREQADCWGEMLLDAKRARSATARLATDPTTAISFLREHLKPIEPVDPKRIKTFLLDLDSPRYAARDAASRRLAALGERVRPALEIERKNTKSAEVRSRLDRLLDNITIVRTPERTRYFRSLILLERIANTAAAALLADLGKGDPNALETQLANDSLRRIRK